MLLSDAILKYEEHIKFRSLSKNTVNAYNKELKYLLEYLTEVKGLPIYIDKITLRDLEEYIKSKRKKEMNYQLLIDPLAL